MRLVRPPDAAARLQLSVFVARFLQEETFTITNPSHGRPWTCDHGAADAEALYPYTGLALNAQIPAQIVTEARSIIRQRRGGSGLQLGAVGMHGGRIQVRLQTATVSQTQPSTAAAYARVDLGGPWSHLIEEFQVRITQELEHQVLHFCSG